MNKGETITLLEACKLLKKSKRTVSRYIKNGWLKPERIESKRGTLEYRFNRSDLSRFKKPGKTEDRTEQTRPEGDIITFLKDQIKVKDEQINQLIERSRETNILLKGLQNQLLLTGDKKEDRKDREAKADKRGQGLNGFFKRLFNR
jgi:excisionase family DNA binding protein